MSQITSRATLDIFGKHCPKAQRWWLSIHYIHSFLHLSIRKCKSRNEDKSFLENKTEKRGKKFCFWIRIKERKGNAAFIFPLALLWTMQEKREKKCQSDLAQGCVFKNLQCVLVLQTTRRPIVSCGCWEGALCVRKAHWIFFNDLGGKGHLL